MTRIADYARFSTDLQSDRSIADQQRLCEELAATIAPGGGPIRHFSDAALSGASMIGRSGVQSLLRAARAREFDVVVAESLDRLSRDQADIATIYKLLKFAGVRLVTFAEGEIDEMKIGFKGTMNALFLNDLRQKTRRGLRGRVEAGKSAGGRSYGYRVVRALVEADRGELEIVPEKAAVVQRIFRAFVAGVSPKAIAKTLNAEGVAGPQGTAWSPSTIHGHSGRGTGLLNNELYIGRRVWNRQRYVKDPATGRRVSRPNPREEWIVTEVPHLRILDGDLWQQGKARQAATRHEVKPGIVRARRPKYLFSGLTICETCRGGFILSSHDLLTCFNARERGTCTNRRSIRRQEVESRVLRAMRERFFEPGAFAEFCAGFTEELNRLRREHRVQLAAAPPEIASLDRRSKEILELLLQGFRDEKWKAELRHIEARRTELEAMIAAGATNPPAPALHPQMADVFQRKAAQLAAALEQDEERDAARQALRGFLDKIVIPPGEGLPQVVGNLGEMLTAASGRNGSVVAAVGQVGCGGRI